MGSRVYLGRLSHSARERDVESFFKGYGKIREIVLKDGFGFIVSFQILAVFVLQPVNILFDCVVFFTG